MTPDRADYELWLVQPAVRYSTTYLVRQMEKAARKALSDGYQEFAWSMMLTDAGALLIKRLS